MPPAAGGASPPGPPDRVAPGGGYGFEFLLRKNYKTGVIIYQFISSIGGTPPRHVAGRSQGAKRPCHRRLFVRYCAQLPEPDCKSGRVAHKVCRLPRKRHGLPRNSPPTAGGVSPPLTGKMPASGLFSISLFALSAELRTGTLPVVIQRQNRWPSETITATA